MKDRDRWGEGGSVSLLTLVFGGVILLLVGLVYDGGQILTARQQAYAAASEASRAGAQALTPNLRAGTTVDVNPAVATQAATLYLDPLGYQPIVTINGAAVTVTAATTVDLGVLGRLLNLPTATVTATATSHAERGVRKENG